MLNSFKNIWKNNMQLLSYSYKASKAYFILTFVLTLSNTLVTFFYLWVQQFSLNGLVHHNVGLISIISVIILYFAYAFICSSLTNLFNEGFDRKAEQKIREYVNTLMLKNLKKFDIANYENPEFYDKFVVAMSEIDSRVFDVVQHAVGALCSVIFVIIMMLTIGAMHPIYFALALILVINSCVQVAKTSKAHYDWTIAQTPLNRAVSYIVRVFYMRNFAKEMKIFYLHDLFAKKYKNIVTNLIETQKPFTKRLFKATFVSDIVVNSANLVIFILLVRDVYLQNILVGDFVLMLSGIYYVVERLSGLVDVFPKFREQSLYIDNINKVLEYQPQIPEDNNGIDLDDVEISNISVENVSFSYDKNGGENALNNITLSIKKGEKIAIVGENGSGKTTFVNLLLYLYKPDNGMFSLNGNNYTKISTTSIRKKYSTVFQEFEIFALTIAENILMRETTVADEPRIWEALEFAGLAEKVRSLENTIYTPLTKEFEEDGVFLSGGQAQKLAIARAFAKDSEILVFDEPSSALDPVAEHELFEKLLALGENKTVIYISHRMSTTVGADRIYLLEHGSIIESGTHSELIQKKGAYYEMFTVQAEKFKEITFA